MSVWRVARFGRDPLLPSRSKGRWSNAAFEVLYTAQARDGAMAEIFALLRDQPVMPSKLTWSLHRLDVTIGAALFAPDVASLGLDPLKFKDRDYGTTQAIGDAAFFLGFEALLVPSARWPCHNPVLFTERLSPNAIVLKETECLCIDWDAWRKAANR